MNPIAAFGFRTRLLQCNSTSSLKWPCVTSWPCWELNKYLCTSWAYHATRVDVRIWLDNIFTFKIQRRWDLKFLSCINIFVYSVGYQSADLRIAFMSWTQIYKIGWWPYYLITYYYIVPYIPFLLSAGHWTDWLYSLWRGVFSKILNCTFCKAQNLKI